MMKAYRLSAAQVRALQEVGSELMTTMDCAKHTVTGEKTLHGMNTTTLDSLVEHGYLTRELLSSCSRTMKVKEAGPKGFRLVNVLVYQYRWTPTNKGRNSRHDSNGGQND